MNSLSVFLPGKRASSVNECSSPFTPGDLNCDGHVLLYNPGDLYWHFNNPGYFLDDLNQPGHFDRNFDHSGDFQILADQVASNKKE